MTDEYMSIEDLLERSSLGTTGAQALRKRTSPTVAREISHRATLLAQSADAAVGPPQAADSEDNRLSEDHVSEESTRERAVVGRTIAHRAQHEPGPQGGSLAILDDKVRAAQNGDSAALTAVLASVQEPILRYCRGRVGIGERHLFSADDIAQEALMAVMTALPRYQDQGKPFMAFVYCCGAQGSGCHPGGGAGQVRSGRKPSRDRRRRW